MAKGIIVGKDVRSVTDKGTGEMKEFRTLHVLWDKPRRLEDGFDGQKVSAESAPFSVDDLKIGDYCFFDYDTRITKSGTFARLADVDVLAHVDMSIFAKAVSDASKK